MKECTFKPKTNNKTVFSAISVDSVSRHSKRSSVSSNSGLYFRGALRQDRSPIDVEYEKQKQECSFKPYLFTKSKKSKSPLRSRGMQTSPKPIEDYKPYRRGKKDRQSPVHIDRHFDSNPMVALNMMDSEIQTQEINRFNTN